MREIRRVESVVDNEGWMNQNDLHSFLRKKTIKICELPEEDIVELDKEVADAQDRYPTNKKGY